LSTHKNMQTWHWQIPILTPEPEFSCCHWTEKTNYIYTFIFITEQAPFLSAPVPKDILEMVMDQMDVCASVTFAYTTLV
jgi:hypothetical protein